jgi:purine-nucleoside phosphorylase
MPEIIFSIALVALIMITTGLLFRSDKAAGPVDPKKAAIAIRRKLRVSEDAHDHVAIVLGTGWGEAVSLEDERSVFLAELPGFEKLPRHPTHQRLLCYGRLNGHWVFILRGRVHMNEIPYDTELADMVRLQIEMLCAFGVKKFILTAAVGGLLRGYAPENRHAFVGTICAIDGFVTLFAPDMPLYGGEFVCPEDALDSNLRRLAAKAGQEVGLTVFEGGHVMVRGPFFEGRRYDKIALSLTNADVVGMSILPEACVAALHRASVLGLGYVTNDDAEECSDEVVRSRVRAASAKLGAFLHSVISRI